MSCHQEQGFYLKFFWGGAPIRRNYPEVKNENLEGDLNTKYIKVESQMSAILVKQAIIHQNA